jgi:hypothetical protein
MNSIVRTSVISAEPVQLDVMKNWLKVPPNVKNDDFEIADLITEARIQAELITNCALVRSTFVQYLDHFPGAGARERDYFSVGGGGGHSGAGMGYDRHQKWHGEIKIKRPPLISVQPIVFIATDGRPNTLNPGQDFVVDTASQPGRIRPIPYTIWPLTLHVPAAIAIPFTAGYAPNSGGIAAGQKGIAEPETDTSAESATWQPGKVFAQYSFQADENDNFWIQSTGPSGTTGALPRPAFEAGAIGAVIADNTASWLNVGPLRGFWAPGTQYAGNQAYVLLDFNSNLQLLNVAALVSQTIAPYSMQVVGLEPLPWATVLGGLTTDNGVAGAWRCLGPYIALGDTGLALPNSPEQQAGFTADWTLPKTVNRFIKALCMHWYYNREPVTQGSANKVPYHLEDMLAAVTVTDFAPTP